MRLDGASTDEICEALDVEKRTVYLWFGDPLVKAEVQCQLERINEVFAEKLAGAATSALDKLRELAEAPIQGPISPETKLKALKELLDRAGSQGRLAQGENVFSELSDRDLVSLTEGLIGRAKNGDPAQHR